MNNPISNRTVTSILAIIALGLAVLVVFADTSENPGQIEPSLYAPSPTLEETNAHRARLGLEPVDNLPWINPETGRNIYEERQEFIAIHGIEEYRRQFIDTQTN